VNEATQAMSFDVRVAHWAELDPVVAYGILRVRSAVFVVEQRCAYLDPDGKDLADTALHLWISHNGEVASTLRLLRLDEGVHKIGRVATDPRYRQRGFAGALMERAIELTDGPVVLNAQSHLSKWYATFGFTVSGDEWVEDGIAHLPMRLVRPRG